MAQLVLPQAIIQWAAATRHAPAIVLTRAGSAIQLVELKNVQPVELVGAHSRPDGWLEVKPVSGPTICVPRTWCKKGLAVDSGRLVAGRDELWVIQVGDHGDRRRLVRLPVWLTDGVVRPMDFAGTRRPNWIKRTTRALERLLINSTTTVSA